MRLHVYEWGDGDAPPVVCVHGVSAHGQRFRRLAEERLASRFRVLAPDLRGHGRSEWEPPWTFATFVDDLLETLDAAGIERAQWVGHSFGGRLCIEVAARAPERVERIALLDPALDLLPHVALDIAEMEWAGRTYASPEEAVESRLDGNPFAPREFVEEDVEQYLAQERDGRWRYRFCRSAVVSVYGELATPPPPAEAVTAPILLVHAARFGLVREEHLGWYPQAQLVSVPGGHIVMWDAYEETAAAVERFLENSRAER